MRCWRYCERKVELSCGATDHEAAPENRDGTRGVDPGGFSSAYFNPEFGATRRAELPEQNGTYAIAITTPANEHLKTITGSTLNGIIKVHWDLTDDYGRKCTNSAFGTLVHVTLPDSERSQTLRGP